jgi:hypothetical protein
MTGALFDLLQASLPSAVPPEPVEIVGAWSTRLKRKYANPSQFGTGDGPFEEIIDDVWSGTANCSLALAAVGFLQLADKVYWARSKPPVESQPIKVQLVRNAQHWGDTATFATAVGDSHLPGVPVTPTVDLTDRWLRSPIRTTTGLPCVLCASDTATLFVVLVQKSLVRTGRTRNWRLKQPAVTKLPSELHRLFTERRAGVWTQLEPP